MSLIAVLVFTWIPITFIVFKNLTDCHYQVSITPKCHILTQHVPQILEETGKGLGEGSEEVVEATHSKFEKIWAWYKVNNLEDPQHGENLLASVIDFNSMNI